MARKRPYKLDLPVSKLSGVGPKLAPRLNRIGIYTVQDLLFHLPYRYIDQTKLTPIGALLPGQEALTQGVVELTSVKFGKRRTLLCRISDGTGALMLRFFHFNRLQQAGLARGTCVRCWGTPRRRANTLEMIHPEYQRIAAENMEHVEQTLTPVYPATEGLAQGRLRKLTALALQALQEDSGFPLELLPEQILAEYDLPDLPRALAYVHRPPPDADTTALMQGVHPAQQRLSFEELLAQHLALQDFRKQVKALQAPVLNPRLQRIEALLKQLPFRLTSAQQRVLSDIQGDIQQAVPMLRLVQGDVGSGKTILAAVAALQAIDAGFQAALMAPTELLADQHCTNIRQWLADFEVTVLLLSGKLSNAGREAILNELAASRPLIVVGTHALFQQQVKFGRLGFIIIDEQHRFGVHQRLALFEKGATQENFPHQLIMTATPIPRTLMMTAFADLDISILDELPPGRQPVKTVVIANEKRSEIIDRIANVCNQGHQAYWVCTLIEESDAVQYQAATDTHEYLSGMLPDLHIGLVHGRMKTGDKEQVMSAYKSGTIDVLVATTVIEVGMDVPAASLMVIENAERLGLSQLHQLRGRVGRGTQDSVCVMMYQPPLTEIARARLEIIRSSNDGFKIAQQDMELRGPGEIFGTRQTGLPELRIANLMRDAVLIPRVQSVANILLEKYPDKVPLFINRWLAHSPAYGKV